MTNEERQAQLLAQAEKEIKDRLAEKPTTQGMTLSDIEHWVLQTGQQVQAKLLEELVQASQEAQNVEAPVSEHCGSRMQRRGSRPRQVITEVGQMTLERADDGCPGCGVSLFPPR